MSVRIACVARSALWKRARCNVRRCRNVSLSDLDSSMTFEQLTELPATLGLRPVAETLGVGGIGTDAFVSSGGRPTPVMHLGGAMPTPFAHLLRLHAAHPVPSQPHREADDA